jgi:hypothetical protein
MKPVREELEDAIDLQEDPPEAARIFGIVSVRPVFAEANWARHLVGPLANSHFYPEVSQSCHRSHIKIRYRLRSQRYLPLPSVACLDTKQMVDEIEVDLKNSFAERNRGGREPARRHVESDVPGMIEPWSLRQSNFADNLSS